MTSINDYWIAKMAATEAGGEEAPEEETVEGRDADKSDDEESEDEPEPAVIYVDANYRPVADPDNYVGEVFEYNPKRDPEEVRSPEPDPEPNYDPEIPPGEDPVPAETVNPDDVEEGEVVDGTELAPGLIDEEEQEKRKAAEEEAAENAVKNAEAAMKANAEAVAPEEDPNEGLPAETVVPEEVPEDEEPEADTYEAEKTRATEKVPTSANTKQEIRDYLIYEHGVDPDDLQDQSKAELLELVDDLAE